MPQFQAGEQTRKRSRYSIGLVTVRTALSARLLRIFAKSLHIDAMHIETLDARYCICVGLCWKGACVDSIR